MFFVFSHIRLFRFILDYKFAGFCLLSFARPKESNKEKSPAVVKLPKFIS